MEKTAKMYAAVIVPLPIEGAFTYIVPPDMQSGVHAGSRVLVPFGERHYYTGVVCSTSPVAPQGSMVLKEIAAVLDPEPIVRHPQIRFWEWMAQYYLCTVGEVYKAALPAGLKLESETRVAIDPDAEPDAIATCSPRELALLETIREKGPVPVRQLEAKGASGSLTQTITRLMERGLVIVSEKLVERYRAVKRHYVRPLLARHDKGAMAAAFAAVKRSSAQEAALVAILALSNFNNESTPLVEVPLDVLAERADVSRATVKALAAKGLCEIYHKEVSRFSYSGPAGGELPALSQAQKQALDSIHHSFIDHAITLLRGVTSSGKTEIYLHLIDYVLRQGRQALFLVPEIALTTQLTTRLQKVFGAKVVIYHSKFSDNERVEIWRRLLHTAEPLVVIGARSAVFLPFASLGLVIVDEEHEPSYKQADPAPRYNGRDAATVLAAMHGAKTLLGSATPTVETYYKGLTGKFGLVELTERYDNVPLPTVEIVDMKVQRQRKAVTGYFSHHLLDATIDAANRGRQAIFFLNRRGYAPMARCRLCACTPKCNFCDVALTYHKRTDRLQCHYCGAEYPVPKVCPECKEPTMEIVGYGTERLEDEVAEVFPGRKILRMDLDTTRNKQGYSKIIDDFSQGKADILVGTQMVTKGLDFAGVEVVGILNADSLLSLPDFRASERAFNMIEQVAGRAGRRDGIGKVVIQTHNPENPVLALAAAHDYLGFYKREIAEREAFSYPPFMRIINIYVKHRDARTVVECADIYARSLREIFGQRIMGPLEPTVSRVQSMYIRKIMLKLEPAASTAKIKELLRQRYIALTASPLMKELTVYYDVDPV